MLSSHVLRPTKHDRVTTYVNIPEQMKYPI